MTPLVLTAHGHLLHAHCHTHNCMQNWGKLQQGLVVWLDLPVGDIVDRLSGNPEEVAKRPLLQGGEGVKERLQALYDERQAMYQQV